MSEHYIMNYSVKAIQDNSGAIQFETLLNPLSKKPEITRTDVEFVKQLSDIIKDYDLIDNRLDLIYLSSLCLQNDVNVIKAFFIRRANDITDTYEDEHRELIFSLHALYSCSLDECNIKISTPRQSVKIENDSLIYQIRRALVKQYKANFMFCSNQLPQDEKEYPIFFKKLVNEIEAKPKKRGRKNKNYLIGYRVQMFLDYLNTQTELRNTDKNKIILNRQAELIYKILKCCGVLEIDDTPYPADVINKLYSRFLKKELPQLETSQKTSLKNISIKLKNSKT